MNFYLYILQSELDKGFYVGISSNVENRLIAHNAGSTRSTKHRRPFSLVHVESFPNRQLAREREKFLKSYAGAGEKMKILEHCRIV
jgi:putative endonuclease